VGLGFASSPKNPLGVGPVKDASQSVRAPLRVRGGGCLVLVCPDSCNPNAFDDDF
jgi:hypothetical protein